MLKLSPWSLFWLILLTASPEVRAVDPLHSPQSECGSLSPGLPSNDPETVLAVLEAEIPGSFRISDNGSTIRRLSETGKVIGAVLLGVGHDTVQPVVMKVISSFQGRGVATLMMAKALVEHPDPVQIHSDIAGTNMDAYLEAVESGKTPLEAIRETPAYKIRRRFGYSEIVHYSIGEGDYPLVHFTVERPR